MLREIAQEIVLVNPELSKQICIEIDDKNTLDKICEKIILNKQ